MHDFTIIHLSDLHIRKKLSKTLKNLLKSIEKETKGLNNIIIILTGDIINAGDYKDGYKTALNFFGKLQKILEKKCIDIQIVPGNHDKVRTEEGKYLALVQQEKLLDQKNLLLQVGRRKQNGIYL